MRTDNRTEGWEGMQRDKMFYFLPRYKETPAPGTVSPLINRRHLLPVIQEPGIHFDSRSCMFEQHPLGQNHGMPKLFTEINSYPKVNSMFTSSLKIDTLTTHLHSPLCRHPDNVTDTLLPIMLTKLTGQRMGEVKNLQAKAKLIVVCQLT